MKPSELVRLLKQLGWREVSQKGSHLKFKHPAHPHHVIVPMHKKDLPTGTAESIMKKAGLK